MLRGICEGRSIVGGAERDPRLLGALMLGPRPSEGMETRGGWLYDGRPAMDPRLLPDDRLGGAMLGPRLLREDEGMLGMRELMLPRDEPPEGLLGALMIGGRLLPDDRLGGAMLGPRLPREDEGMLGMRELMLPRDEPPPEGADGREGAVMRREIGDDGME